jgi:hypothetical protein
VDPAEMRLWDDVPVTTIERTLVDLCAARTVVGPRNSS